MSTQHAPYNYALAPYVKQSEGNETFWAPPAWAMAGIDLGNLSDCAIATGDHRPVGLFWGTGTPDSNAAVLGNGDCREISATAAMRSAWKSNLGYMPQGATLLDLLNDQLTNGSDPTGANTVKPLMPTLDGNLEIWMPGHSLVRSEAFVFGKHPHTNRVAALLQNDYAAMWDAEQAGHQKPGQRLKVLDFWMKQYKVSDPDQFLPRAHKGEKPLPHETTYTDNFNRANASALGSPWTAVNGTASIVSNQAQMDPSQNFNQSQRYDADLSSADHSVQADLVVFSTGSNHHARVLSRFSSSAQTYYGNVVNNFGTRIDTYKFVAGAGTSIGHAALSFSLATQKMQSSGSTQTAYYNGSALVTVTDTSITGNLRGGLGGQMTDTTPVTFDNFSESDLAASSLLYTQLERNTRGINRGMYVFNGGG